MLAHYNIIETNRKSLGRKLTKTLWNTQCFCDMKKKYVKIKIHQLTAIRNSEETGMWSLKSISGWDV